MEITKRSCREHKMFRKWGSVSKVSPVSLFTDVSLARSVFEIGGGGWVVGWRGGALA